VLIILLNEKFREVVKETREKSYDRNSEYWNILLGELTGEEKNAFIDLPKIFNDFSEFKMNFW